MTPKNDNLRHKTTLKMKTSSNLKTTKIFRRIHEDSLKHEHYLENEEEAKMTMHFKNVAKYVIF